MDEVSDIVAESVEPAIAKRKFWGVVAGVLRDDRASVHDRT
jgi:hypothetical protein